MNTRQFAVSEKMWYSGRAVMMVSSPWRTLSPIQALAWSMLAIMFSWVSMAPLATPVVPPVYCRNATSAWPRSSLGGLCFAPLSRASGKRMARGSENGGTAFLTCLSTKLIKAPFGKPSRSPIPVVTTCSTSVPSSTSCTVAAKLSTTTMALAPESSSWCFSSRAVYSGLVLTTIRPARRTPNSAMGYCSTFGIMIATRSPRCSCRSCARNAAKFALKRSMSS